MNVTSESLQRVDRHWAVMAVGISERDRGLRTADTWLVNKAVGHEIRIDYVENDQDRKLLERLATAYEMAAIEGIDACLNPASEAQDLREQCASGAWRAFEILRLFDLSSSVDERVFQVLHISALAYCGERWSDLRRWYAENARAYDVPALDDVSWDHRLLYRLFDCWIRLFRKKGWDDLNRIGEVVDHLREDQRIYESGALNSGSSSQDRTMALRLIGLYHWAKATELLASYMLQGEPLDISTLLDKHFEAAVDAATASGDPQQEVLMRWLHVSARQMVSSSVWWVARAVNSRVTKFVKQITKQQAMFELLPPQRAALQEKGLLDQAATAVVIEMPTSGGKTLLAQFRMLQALNQFDMDHGWIAYVAPTRALTAQITRRLRRDFEPIGVHVEQLTGAVEVDAFEDDLLSKDRDSGGFDVLVATPEKLQLVIRNKKVSRPLALVVMDEAHNIADESRGLRIELLLATIKRECVTANFLLMMPYVEKPEVLAHWLAQDVNAGRTISLGTAPWQPNERIVGMYSVEADESIRAGWHLVYDTLTTTPKTIDLHGHFRVGEAKPLRIPKSEVLKKGKQSGLAWQTAAMATVLSGRGMSIAVANRIDSVWEMAREMKKVLPALSSIPEEVRLVQDFLRTEISPDFELIDLLAHGIAVHHAGLSDEVRALVEWLAEEGKLKVLCATSTISQGINFPVSSVFLASRFIPNKGLSREMAPRDFWNLAGRAGRIDHDSVGVVGIAAGENPSEVVGYVRRTTGELVSRLDTLLSDLESAGHLNNLDTVIKGKDWDDFRCYVAHLWNEEKNLDAVLADTEQLLRNTLGYTVLRNSPEGRGKADKLLEATKEYATRLSGNPQSAAYADLTGFSPEGVGRALVELGHLENELDRGLKASDWTPDGLFGKSSGIAGLYGVMLHIPQLSDSLEELAGHGHDNQHIAEITKAWVNGQAIQDIARQFFQAGNDGAEDQTGAITDACRAIYRNLVNTGAWGLSALSRLVHIDFESLSELERRRVNILPAMIYHGVNTEEAVLMRMNSVPRSVAGALGVEFRRTSGQSDSLLSASQARDFLRALDDSVWQRVRPANAALSGTDYKRVWELLSGNR